jgi:pimeloyl-ACP methyl ester carboxylesterase
VELAGEGDVRGDEPAGSAHLERYFTGRYRRVLLDGVGHFPHREAPDAVEQTIHQHLSATPDYWK